MNARHHPVSAISLCSTYPHTQHHCVTVCKRPVTTSPEEFRQPLRVVDFDERSREYLPRRTEDGLDLVFDDVLEDARSLTAVVVDRVDGCILEEVAYRRLQTAFIRPLFPFEFIVALCLRFQHLSHPDDVADPVERRLGDVDRDEDMFTAVTPIVHVLPRLHLVGDGVRVVSKNANSDCIVLGGGCSVNRIKSRVLIAERNEPRSSPTSASCRLLSLRKKSSFSAEPRLQPRRELVRGDLLGFRLRPSGGCSLALQRPACTLRRPGRWSPVSTFRLSTSVLSAD